MAGPGVEILDLAGPLQVFARASEMHTRENPGSPPIYSVEVATISSGRSLIANCGLRISADRTFREVRGRIDTLLVAGGDAIEQNEINPDAVRWLRRISGRIRRVGSVCTGAFVLAKTGLLNGKSATTYHGAFGRFATQFPDVQLKRGARFVENGNLATAGGLSSGIDLALRVVERYYGREVARKTAYNMEYQGQGWMNPDSNQLYASPPVSTAEHPLCTMCGMGVDPKVAPKSVFKGATYYFCSEDDKKTFDAAPEKFVSAENKSL